MLVKIETLAQKITAISGAVVVVFSILSGAYYWLHVKDVEGLRCNTVVPRIVNALNVRCQAIQAGNDPTTLEIEIINPLFQEYAESCGREFSMGMCKDGKRVSSFAMPQ